MCLFWERFHAVNHDPLFVSTGLAYSLFFGQGKVLEYPNSSMIVAVHHIDQLEAADGG
jgi:hypothetical protein